MCWVFFATLLVKAHVCLPFFLHLLSWVEYRVLVWLWDVGREREGEKVRLTAATSRGGKEARKIKHDEERC